MKTPFIVALIAAQALFSQAAEWGSIRPADADPFDDDAE